MTAVDVAAAPVDRDRDWAVHGWCGTVWQAYSATDSAIAELLRTEEFLPGSNR
jgi:hypothetical protein